MFAFFTSWFPSYHVQSYELYCTDIWLLQYAGMHPFETGDDLFYSFWSHFVVHHCEYSSRSSMFTQCSHTFHTMLTQRSHNVHTMSTQCPHPKEVARRLGTESYSSPLDFTRITRLHIVIIYLLVHSLCEHARSKDHY